MNRTLFPAALALLAACSGDDGGTDTGATPGDRVSQILALTPDTANGASLYSTNCALCHGAAGEGIQDLGSNIQAVTDQQSVVVVVIDGNDDGMTAFGDLLTDQEIADVSGYVVSGQLGP